jgi:hypothetical protein
MQYQEKPEIHEYKLSIVTYSAAIVLLTIFEWEVNCVPYTSIYYIGLHIFYALLLCWDHLLKQNKWMILHHLMCVLTTCELLAVHDYHHSAYACGPFPGFVTVMFHLSMSMGICMSALGIVYESHV